MFKNFFKKLWKDESGQSATEYILILAVIVAIILVVRSYMPEKFKQLIDSAMDKVTSGFSSK